MSTNFKIALIGAGNVAWHLAPALENAGHLVTVVYNRNLKKAKNLALKLQAAKPTDNLDFRTLDAAIFIITVADLAFEDVISKALFPENSLIFHTSGSHDLSIFQKYKILNCGVFYPLQTFSKSKPVNFSEIPICLEAAIPESEKILLQVAESISSQVRLLSSAERRVLHVAAVFACNFTNHLLGISRDMLERSQLDTTLLQPLIQETISKATEYHPFTVQTGPAARGDENIIRQHLQMLQNEPVYRQLYYLLSESISRTQAKSTEK